jgi:hypothetical protein
MGRQLAQQRLPALREKEISFFDRIFISFFSTNPNIFYFSRFFLKKEAPEPVEGPHHLKYNK